ncbi:MAG: thiosulfate oxidation carrier protein SoxY [Paracoccaceae bacterium]
MKLTRRDALALGLGVTAASFLPSQSTAAVDDAIAQFTGGASVGLGGVTLIAPEIAENGNSVPISVDAPGASAILVIATGNRVPKVALFHFGALARRQAASTRISLTCTQDVVALAHLRDGSFVQTAQTVKVTFRGRVD